MTSKKLSYSLALISGVLYFLPFFFPTLFILSWFALVPLLLAIRHKSIKDIYFLGFISGSTSYCFGLYFLANLSKYYFGLFFPLNYLFLLAVALVGGNFLALSLVLFTWLKQNCKITNLLLFPSCLVFVSLYNFLVFTPEFGASQSKFYYAVQAIEFTGVQGASWILFLTNMFNL